MYDMNIIQQNGGKFLDSRDVAEIIGKRHDNLLRDIEGYLKTFAKSNVLKIEGVNFFIKNTYLDAKGETRPCYLISKMGCEMVANKLTGEKGILFTAAYVAKFNEMETAERAELEALAAAPIPRLGEYNAASRLIIRAMKNAGATSEQVIDFLQGVYEPLGFSVFVEIDDNAPRMYTPYQIAEKLGVYSMNGRPHFLAVASMLNALNIDDGHKIAIPTYYGGHISVSVRYDDYAVVEAARWLENMGWPDKFHGDYCTYYLLYA